MAATSNDINAQCRRWRDCVARQRRHPDQPDHTVADVWTQEKPACCPCRRIPSRPTSSAPSAPGRPPTSASTATPTRFPTPTSGSRSRSWPAPPASASSTGRPSSPAIGAATTPGRSSRPPSTSKGSSPPPPRPTHTPPATAFASPSPPPPRFDRVAERGEPLRPHATRLLALLDDYGPQELAAALERDALGAGFIAHILYPCIHRNR